MTAKKSTKAEYIKALENEVNRLNKEADTRLLEFTGARRSLERARAEATAREGRHIQAGLIPIELLSDADIVTNRAGTTAEVTVADKRVVEVIRSKQVGGAWTNLAYNPNLIYNLAPSPLFQYTVGLD